MAAKKPAAKAKSPIVKQGKTYVIKGLNTGRTLGKHPTRTAALKQLRAIESNIHGRGR
jgi:hypothetical protein